MEDLIQLGSPVEVGGASRSYRAVTLLAIIALVVGALVLARHAPGPVANDHKIVNVDWSTAGNGTAKALAFGAVPAQINIGAIVCPILDALIAQLPFLAPILQPVRALFGCISI